MNVLPPVNLKELDKKYLEDDCAVKQRDTIELEASSEELVDEVKLEDSIILKADLDFRKEEALDKGVSLITRQRSVTVPSSGLSLKKREPGRRYTQVGDPTEEEIPHHFVREYRNSKQRFSSITDETIIQQGWLKKQSDHIHSWKKRYFILGSDAVLRYFCDKPKGISWREGDVRGHICLSEILEVCHKELKEGQGIIISTESRDYKVLADDLFTALHWLITLQNAVQSTHSKIAERRNITTYKKNNVDWSSDSEAGNNIGRISPILTLDAQIPAEPSPSPSSENVRSLTFGETTFQQKVQAKDESSRKSYNIESIMKDANVEMKDYVRQTSTPDSNIFRQNRGYTFPSQVINSSGKGSYSSLTPTSRSESSMKFEPLGSSHGKSKPQRSYRFDIKENLPDSFHREYSRTKYRLGAKDKQVIQQGWLTKQGAKVKNWKRRYFVLTSTCLYYSIKKPAEGSSLAAQSRGIINLEDIKEVQWIEVNNRRGISLTTYNREYRLLVDNKDQFTGLHWFITIENAVLNAGGVTSPKNFSNTTPCLPAESTSKKLELEICSGWLEKYDRGTLTSHVKKERFCVLRALPHCTLVLDSYKSDKKAEFKERVDLSGFLGQNRRLWKLKLFSESASFLVVTPTNRWEFCAKDELSAENWYRGIRAWMENHLVSFSPRKKEISGNKTGSSKFLL